MSRKLIVLAAAVFLLSPSYAFLSETAKYHRVEQPMVGDFEVDRPVYSVPLSKGDSQAEILSPGFRVGTTHYDYQTNGSTGNRVVKDSQGGYHFSWMNGIGHWEGNRHVYYNFVDENGFWLQDGGLQVNTEERAGYTTIAVLDDGRAVVAYHSDQGASPLWLTTAIDFFRGFGSFTEYDPPDLLPSGVHAFWPYVSVDRNDNMHIVGRANGDPVELVYTRSSDEGTNWTELAVIDTINQITGQPVSSPVSDKVTIIYSHHLEEDVNHNVGDVYYIESENGVDWDWSQKIKITNYAFEDTFRAWLDLDAVYDYNDRLHIVWNTLLYVPETGEGYVASILWHWSEVTGIRVIADGMWDSNPGGGNLTVSKASIGLDENNNLFVIWTQFSLDDVSVGGYSNGELYASASSNGGLTWGRRVNMTNSPTPDCWPLECDSDHWSSMAEIVDTTLHILYINDKDAGAVVRPTPEGVDTENPVLYLTFPVDTLLRMTGVEEGQTSIPESFVLKQNYPNPFNSSTAIEFETRIPGKVQLSVYNLRGDRVVTLVNDILPAGRHSVNWEAEKVASGVYFYKLSSGGETQSKRMLLLK
jgi:hypothetical protein